MHISDSVYWASYTLKVPKTLIVSVAKKPSLCDMANFRRQGQYQLMGSDCISS